MKNLFKKIGLLALVSAISTASFSCSSDEQDQPQAPVTDTAEPVSADLIYQANPRFFGSSNGLKNLTERLGDIADMGYNILWVMPFYEHGSYKYIGSPYCVKDYKAVDPQLGTLDDMKALVNKAHSIGMKVIFDWVPNHTGWDHVWINSNTDYYKKTSSGAIEAPNGWTDVAQLDYSNPAMRAAMKDAMAYWVKETGIDGYRCDYAEGIPHDFWQEAIAELKALNPNFYMLAEGSDFNFYTDGFDSIYDWNFPSHLQKFTKGNGSGFDLVNASHDILQRVPAGKTILRYVSNHDFSSENDIVSYYGSQNALYAAYAATAFLGGTPMLYSSMEASGISGKLSFFDFRTLNWNREKMDIFRTINQAYIRTADLRGGNMKVYTDNSMLCFTRQNANGTMLVVVNNANTTRKVATPDICKGMTMTELISGNSRTLSEEIELGAYEYAIFRN